MHKIWKPESTSTCITYEYVHIDVKRICDHIPIIFWSFIHYNLKDIPAIKDSKIIKYDNVKWLKVRFDQCA